MSITNDQYILGQSIAKEVKSLGEEIRLDLELQPNPNLDSGTVYGTVKDSIDDPISNALVKIMDTDHEPLAHALTSVDGEYIFINFPPGTDYHIYATATGYDLEEQTPFTLLAKQNIEKDFVLLLDPNAKLSLIAGDVIDKDTKLPVNGAVVNLFEINEDKTETLVGVTFTNEYGQYTFRELSEANYDVKIDSLGYISSSETVNIDAEGQIAHVETSMYEDPETARGTVSGIITNNNNIGIAYADVVLYSVDSDDKLTPIAFTRTNDEGVYLFINVEKGNYKIKSNKTIDVTV
jgi:protocatechuate 3,4-dioxygenase beta subunit